MDFSHSHSITATHAPWFPNGGEVHFAGHYNGTDHPVYNTVSTFGHYPSSGAHVAGTDHPVYHTMSTHGHAGAGIHVSHGPIDLSGAHHGVFTGVHPTGAHVTGAKLVGAHVTGAKLVGVHSAGVHVSAPTHPGLLGPGGTLHPGVHPGALPHATGLLPGKPILPMVMAPAMPPPGIAPSFHPGTSQVAHYGPTDSHPLGLGASSGTSYSPHGWSGTGSISGGGADYHGNGWSGGGSANVNCGGGHCAPSVEVHASIGLPG